MEIEPESIIVILGVRPRQYQHKKESKRSFQGSSSFVCCRYGENGRFNQRSNVNGSMREKDREICVFVRLNFEGKEKNTIGQRENSAGRPTERTTRPTVCVCLCVFVSVCFCPYAAFLLFSFYLGEKAPMIFLPFFPSRL